MININTATKIIKMIQSRFVLTSWFLKCIVLQIIMNNGIFFLSCGLIILNEFKILIILFLVAVFQTFITNCSLVFTDKAKLQYTVNNTFKWKYESNLFIFAKCDIAISGGIYAVKTTTLVNMRSQKSSSECPAHDTQGKTRSHGHK